MTQNPVILDIALSKKMNAAQIIIALGLDDEYDNAILKICKSRHMMQDQAGIDFLYGKLDELTEYIKTHSVGLDTLPEIKPVVLEWIAKQAQEVVKE